jgi:hypothetical protein
MRITRKDRIPEKRGTSFIDSFESDCPRSLWRRCVMNGMKNNLKLGSLSLFNYW